MTKNDAPQASQSQPIGLSNQFVGAFPGFVNLLPGTMNMSNLYPINVLPSSLEVPVKRRKRTNYRDPENAAKLTTALGILLRQKEENKQQDLKAVAAHFGLPYNTLRDNYLKITTGKLTKGDKKSPDSGSSSSENTPREQNASTAALAASAAAAASLYGSGLLPKFEPGVAASAGSLPGSAGSFALPVMTGAVQSAAQQQGNQHVVHFIAATPIGYQFNPATGALVPVYVQAASGPNAPAASPTAAQIMAGAAQVVPGSTSNNAMADLIQYHMQQQQAVTPSGQSGTGNISMLLSASTTAGGNEEQEGESASKSADGPELVLKNPSAIEGASNASSANSNSSNAAAINPPSLGSASSMQSFMNASHASQFGIHIPPLSLPAAYSSSMPMSGSAPPSKSPNQHPLYIYQTTGNPPSGTSSNLSPHPLLPSLRFSGTQTGAETKSANVSGSAGGPIFGLPPNFTYLPATSQYGTPNFGYAQLHPSAEPSAMLGGHPYAFGVGPMFPAFTLLGSAPPGGTAEGSQGNSNSSTTASTAGNATSTLMDTTEAEVAEVLSYLDGSARGSAAGSNKTSPSSSQNGEEGGSLPSESGVKRSEDFGDSQNKTDKMFNSKKAKR